MGWLVEWLVEWLVDWLVDLLADLDLDLLVLVEAFLVVDVVFFALDVLDETLVVEEAFVTVVLDATGAADDEGAAVDTTTPPDFVYTVALGWLELNSVVSSDSQDIVLQYMHSLYACSCTDGDSALERRYRPRRRQVNF